MRALLSRTRDVAELKRGGRAERGGEKDHIFTCHTHASTYMHTRLIILNISIFNIHLHIREYINQEGRYFERTGAE